jgi:outer membrane protein, adhesin transport system
MDSKRFSRCALVLLMAAGAAVAQTADPLKATVEQAINTNPEVSARFNAYRASVDAVDAARGAYLPSIDLNASVGQERDRIGGTSRTLSRRQGGVSLTQLLWDGLATRNDVARAGHEQLARYFELVDVTEQTAVEAAKAHYDVQRYRRMVTLAEDNYVQHRYAFLQIQSRFKAGVGRGVDLEQAGARVALAESNLTTELANLHDVNARYQRLVGSAPAQNLGAISMLRAGVPATAAEAMNTAARQSAAVSASIENLRGARAVADARRSVYQPTVQARVRADAGRNVDGLQDQTRNSTAEIVLAWNLYNGGTDQARVRQQANIVSQATDLRDKACRDTRQTAAIAYNDTKKLADQLIYLDRNTLAIQKARDAYRQQFDIGQRSLLDLLNSENELYTARRAYANAEFDLGLAYARTHAAMNQLGTQLGVSRTLTSGSEAAGWAQGEDAPTRCPVVIAEVLATDRGELDARAQRLAATAPVVAPAPVPAASAPTRKP